MIEISEVKSKKDLKKFLEFPALLYKGDPNYVQELYSVQKIMFDRKKYPFFTHSKADLFLAYKDEEVSGRIAVIRNNNHISHTREKCGFFGFFESVNDQEVSKALLDRAVSWVKSEGLTCLTGPENFTTNDSCGFLISGFDLPPVVMMPYNKEYYDDLMMSYGFKKEIDLFSYLMENDRILASPSLETILKKYNDKLSSNGVTFRNINYKNLREEVIPFHKVYNESNKGNWGFLPLSEREFRETAELLEKFVPDNLMLFAEKDKKMIGFIVALPDLNQVFSHIRSGRLFPFGLFKYLYYKRKITKGRILILGILDEYRNKGVDLILYKKIQENLNSLGIYSAEACYVMENNKKMNSIIEKIGGVKVKEYRIYKLEL